MRIIVIIVIIVLSIYAYLAPYAPAVFLFAYLFATYCTCPADHSLHLLY